MKKLLSLFVAGALAFGLMSCADGSVSLAAADLHDMTVDKISLGSNIKFRGSPNGWGTTDLTSSGSGVWYVEFAADASDITFKFSDADWSKANTYNDSYMVAGTLPTGAALTNTDDGNGSTNAKITGLSKDSKYKMVITADNSGKLKIDVLSANYTLFTLSGYAVRGFLSDDKGEGIWDVNKDTLIKQEKFTEDVNHSLTYPFTFKATAEMDKRNFKIATDSWDNVYAGAVFKVDEKGNAKETILRQRRINGTPYAYDTAKEEFVELTKEVTYRVPLYYTTDGKKGSDVVAVKDVTDKKTQIAENAEFEAKYIAEFNFTGKSIVASDPSKLEDGSFKKVWAKLSEDEKKDYENSSDVDKLIKATVVGKPGKLTVYADNTYYPTDKKEKNGDIEDKTMRFDGLKAGSEYCMLVKVTTKGVVSVQLISTVPVAINFKITDIPSDVTEIWVNGSFWGARWEAGWPKIVDWGKDADERNLTRFDEPTITNGVAVLSNKWTHKNSYVPFAEQTLAIAVVTTTDGWKAGTFKQFQNDGVKFTPEKEGEYLITYSLKDKTYNFEFVK
ncbi:MAG: hypothetical protein MR877_03825 [Spirochaetia bacterium]|nr:hypothetical protein [Spirochaetia bacterium]